MKKFVFGILVFLAGCGTPESVKRTNYFDGQAAKWIEAHSTDPAVRRAAATIAAGCEQIARKLGHPEETPAYTPETHEATVAQAKSDLDQQEAITKGITGWVERAVTKVADWVWPGLGGLLTGAWFWLRKKAQYDKLKEGAAPIVKVVDEHPEIAKKIMEYATGIGVGKPVKAAVDLLKKK